MVRNCNPLRSQPCGRACISLTRTCRKNIVPVASMACAPKPKRTRKEPTCTEGRTYKCGKACISVTRPCRKTNTPAPGAPVSPYWNRPDAEHQGLINEYEAALAAELAAPIGSCERRGLRDIREQKLYDLLMYRHLRWPQRWRNPYITGHLPQPGRRDPIPEQTGSGATHVIRQVGPDTLRL